MAANANDRANRLDPSPNRHIRALWTLGAVGGMADADLLARFVAGTGRAGDAEAAELAFGALVDRHGGTVLRGARMILGDEAASLDASQATFFLLARKARHLSAGDSLAPWLVAVARRVALGARKAQARRDRHEAAAARPESAPGSDDAARGETIRAVLAEVDRLPEPFRAAVVACHLDGLTQQAAAARLGWPVGTLQSRLDRGRRQLRDRLTRRGLAPSALGLLPPSGLGLSFPSALVPPLARAATLWAVRACPPSLIAPGVLALVGPSSKGLLMISLKLGTLALGATLAVAGSGWTWSQGPPVRSDPVAPAIAAGPAVGIIEPEPEPEAQHQPGPPRPALAPASPVIPDRSRMQIIAGDPDRDQEPELTRPPMIPLPWETAVRVRVKIPDKQTGAITDDQIAVGSGTVIASTATESFVLICGHTVREGQNDRGQPRRILGPVVVDLFGKDFVKQQPATLACTERDLPAQVVAVHDTEDLALLRIHPGKVLPVSPIMASSWAATTGTDLISVGCSDGRDATAWDTTLLESKIKMNSASGRPFFMTKCNHQPANGRSGGGLFTTRGYLVGVCAFSDPIDKVGLYVEHPVIEKLNEVIRTEGNETALDLDGLQAAMPGMQVLVGRADGPPGANRATATDSPPTAQDRRLDELERKLDRLVESLARDRAVPTAPRPGRRSFEDIVTDLDTTSPTSPAATDPAGRVFMIDPETGRPIGPRVGVRPRPAPPVGADPGPGPDPSEPGPAPAVSGQERRLGELERKLDRVLETLDNMRGQMGPMRSHGGLGP